MVLNSRSSVPVQWSRTLSALKISMFSFSILDRAMKRIFLTALFLMSACVAGCLKSMVSFEAPPYELIDADDLPAKMKRSFAKSYPETPISQAGTRVWPPTGDDHFRITFMHGSEEMEIRYNAKGKPLGGPKAARPDERPESD